MASRANNIPDQQSDSDDLKTLNEAVASKRSFLWCQKYEVLFRLLYEDEELRNSIREYNVYQPPQDHPQIYRILHECMENAYEYDVVVTHYGQVISDNNLSDQDVANPTKEWVDSLTVEEILACIAWHFRRDHFSEGSWISVSVAEGHMMAFVQGVLEKLKDKQ